MPINSPSFFEKNNISETVAHLSSRSNMTSHYSKLNHRKLQNELSKASNTIKIFGNDRLTIFGRGMLAAKISYLPTIRSSILVYTIANPDYFNRLVEVEYIKPESTFHFHPHLLGTLANYIKDMETYIL